VSSASIAGCSLQHVSYGDCLTKRWNKDTVWGCVQDEEQKAALVHLRLLTALVRPSTAICPCNFPRPCTVFPKVVNCGFYLSVVIGGFTMCVFDAERIELKEIRKKRPWRRFVRWFHVICKLARVRSRISCSLA